MRAALCCLVLAVMAAAPSGAQSRMAPPPPAGPAPVSVRGFGLIAGESFAASDTFDAVLGGSFQPFWGGGVGLIVHDNLFVDVTVSRFRKTGERAFAFNGQTFHLGIPLTVTVTPIEVSGGYRFQLPAHRWLVPYAGAGVGRYAYRETSDFSDGGEDVDVSHVGYLVVGGAEFRVHPWIGLGVDAQYTHVSGILGNGGISQQVGEDNLGGVAARLKVIVGR